MQRPVRVRIVKASGCRSSNEAAGSWPKITFAILKVRTAAALANSRSGAAAMHKRASPKFLLRQSFMADRACRLLLRGRLKPVSVGFEHGCDLKKRLLGVRLLVFVGKPARELGADANGGNRFLGHRPLSTPRQVKKARPNRWRGRAFPFEEWASPRSRSRSRSEERDRPVSLSLALARCEPEQPHQCGEVGYLPDIALGFRSQRMERSSSMTARPEAVS